MIKFSIARKAIAILANVSLLFNSFVPFLLAAQPVYAQSLETVVSTIEYNQSANKLNINVNTSEKIAYQLFYKTDKIDAIAGDDLDQADFYLGTCSASVCLPQNISRGILKTEFNSKFYSQFFTLENNVLTITKESESLQSDLTKEENDFLNDSILGVTTNWTFENVELNKEYIAPQNSGVKLTFTKLPENSGNIKIEEITLTPEQIEQSGSLSDKAYDITSDMLDGTFAYNLSLPIPESAKGQNVDIKFAEEISQINSAQIADNTTETNSTATTTNLDHFTIFIVSGIKLDPKVYINEFVYNPSNGSGWIELYNGENNEINLSNWKLNDLDGYSISLSGSISSHGFKSFDINWLNKTTNNYLGDTVILQKKGLFGIYYPVDSINYNRILGQQNVSDDNIMLGKSLGRSTDGGSTWTSFSNPTKNISNTTDVTPPSVPSLVSPLNNSFIKGASVTNEWSVVDDAVEYIYESYHNQEATNLRWHQVVSAPAHSKTATNVADATFWWRVKSVDAVGNTSPWSPLWKVTIDNTNPIIPSNLSFSAIDGKVLSCDSVTNLYTIVAKWNASSDTNFSHYEYKSFNPPNGWVWNGGNIGNVLSKVGTLNGGEGTYGFAVRAVDKASNVSDWTSLDLANSCKITYDKTLPVITLGAYTTAPTNQDITVTATTNEGTLNVGSTTFTSNGSFDFIATDSAGNVATKTVTITNIDKDIPNIPTAIFTANGINVLSNGYTVFKNFKFNLSSSSDTTRYQLKYWNNIDGSTFKINKPWNPTNLSGYSSSLGVYNDNFTQGEGTHYFTFSACDAANNCSAYSTVPFTVTYDKTAPSPPVLIGNSTIYIKPGYVKRAWNASDSNDVVKYIYKSFTSEAYANTPDTSPAWTPDATPVVFGNTEYSRTDRTGDYERIFWWRVAAVDAAGNKTWSDEIHKVVVDKTAPILSNKTIFEDIWYNTDQTSTFNFTDENGIVSGNNPTCTINTEGAQQTCSVDLNVCDIAGNCNIETIISNGVNIDKTNPTINSSINPVSPDGQNGWYWTQPEITLTGIDANLDKIEYQWDSQVEGSWTTYSVAIKPLTEGNHDLYYRAIDKAGNVSTIGSKNIRWDKTDLEYGPKNLSANPNPTSGSTSKIKWEMGKDNTGIDKYEIQWKLDDSHSYSKTVGAGTTEVEIDQLIEGKWTVKVVAFDQSGRAKDASIDLNVDRTSPTAPTLVLDSTGTSTATLSWNAIDDAKDYIIWYGSVQGIHPYGARVGNVTSYTVKGLGAGNYYFIVKAVDAAQNQSSDSNEVNTGTIIGAAGTTPNQPAEGFSTEVLGANTEEEINPTTTPAIELGDVLGSSTSEKLINWWWLLLLIIPLYVIGRKLSKKKK